MGRYSCRRGDREALGLVEEAQGGSLTAIARVRGWEGLRGRYFVLEKARDLEGIR